MGLLSDYAFFENGVSDTGQVVGNTGDGTSIPRVVRYTFVAPPEGANGFSFIKENVSAYSSSSSTSEQLRFYISDDPNSHTKANATYAYHGTVAMASASGWYKATGSVSDIILLPGKTYYLFIFPAHTSFGLWYWNYPGEISATLSGGAGLARIHNGSDWDMYQCHIYNGSGWDLYLPYIYNGSEWELYSG